MFNTFAISWGPSPIIFEIGFFALRWYSLCFIVSFLIGYRLLKPRFLEAGLTEKHLDKLLLYVILATIIGARLGHVLFYDFEYYSQRHFAEALLPISLENGFEFVERRIIGRHGVICCRIRNHC